MNRKLGINCDCIREDIDTLETLALVHTIGFDSTFTKMSDRRLIAAIKNKTIEYGMDFEFIHAPFRGANVMWQAGEDYLPLFNGILETIDCADECDVDTIVMHVSSGWHTPPLCDVGFSRFDRIVEYADKHGVRIAFENVRKLGDHAAILHRYENVPHVGFCYDAGHEHCYTETVPFIDLYHARMWCTHLHDNLGRDHNDLEADGDFHYLPLDGTKDYKAMIDKMDRYGYTGSLMLEVFNSTKPEYQAMSPEAFIRLAYERVKTISAL